ncbi:peptidase M23 [Intrasporangium chromatireducens Q5-1]|uniref:Peptidase M23 n=1 Tax=Intrasporangium chromatireducens Q5-1 TaxID=584657 RepID=W9GPP1_9MICO|nr:peptidoglycan DD-metalloendopeptidase family protein [Intrasporangium chromatireducens]EWT06803.1 peptidase M23 [Intrasporangium chromatireducens Q5-1]
MAKVLAVVALIGVLLGAPLLAAIAIAGAAVPAVAVSTRGACGTAPASGQWRPPFVQAYTVSSRGIGWSYHPVFKRWNFHAGQDLSTLPGPGPIVAANTGRVIRAGWDTTGYGNLVDLQHSGGIQTRYAHLATIDPHIVPGATVHAGQRLGVEGSTGASTGNHLHFEVSIRGTRVDPISFMKEHHAPLDGRAVEAPRGEPDTDMIARPAAPPGEGGAGPLPRPGQPRRNSLHNSALPIPADIHALYVAAGNKYGIPWALLAGVGMEETAHGRITGASSAGAQGIMQFMPATWARWGTDGDGDSKADITNPADSIYSAANYLVHSGATDGATGIRRALFAYNHADWYVNDALYYATEYTPGTRAPAPSPPDCGSPPSSAHQEPAQK